MIVCVVLISIGIYRTFKLEVSSNVQNHTQPKYHVALVYDQKDSFNLGLFKESFEENCELKDIAADEYEAKDPASVEYALKSCWLSGVDVVFIKLSSNNQYKDLISETVKRGINVIALGNDAPDSTRDAYIGVNKYQMGKNVIDLIKLSTLEHKRVGIILGPEFDQRTGTSQNSYISAIKEFSDMDKDVEISQIAYTSESRAEIITDAWVKDQSVDIIVCTDAIDSLRSVATLIDLNATSSITVVANGNIPQIKDYIKKGTILGSIYVDYEQIGLRAAEIVETLGKGSRVSSYIAIPLETIDKSNASEGDESEK